MLLKILRSSSSVLQIHIFCYIKDKMSTVSNPAALETDVPLELLHLELVSRLAEKKGHEREKGLADLELLGYNTGYRIIEKLTREHPKFKDELDLMKFICKDFWTSVFKKQIDNLRTNHQGVYVLQDKNFKFLSKVSAGRQYLDDSTLFVVFSCGLVRGCLANLNLNSIVTAEIVSPPAVKFQVQVERN